MKCSLVASVLALASLPHFAFADLLSCMAETDRLADKGINVYVNVVAKPIRSNPDGRIGTVEGTLALKLRPTFSAKCEQYGPMPTEDSFKREADVSVNLIDSGGFRYVAAFDTSGSHAYVTRAHYGRHLQGSILAHSSVVASLLKTIGFDTFESYRSGSYTEFLPADLELSGKPVANQLLLGSTFYSGELFQLMVTSVSASPAQ